MTYLGIGQCATLILRWLAFKSRYNFLSYFKRTKIIKRCCTCLVFKNVFKISLHRMMTFIFGLFLFYPLSYKPDFWPHNSMPATSRLELGSQMSITTDYHKPDTTSIIDVSQIYYKVDWNRSNCWLINGICDCLSFSLKTWGLIELALELWNSQNYSCAKQLRLPKREPS